MESTFCALVVFQGTQGTTLATTLHSSGVAPFFALRRTRSVCFDVQVQSNTVRLVGLQHGLSSRLLGQRDEHPTHLLTSYALHSPLGRMYHGLCAFRDNSYTLKSLAGLSGNLHPFTNSRTYPAVLLQALVASTGQVPSPALGISNTTTWDQQYNNL